MLELNISMGNSKMGAIPSFSLPAGLSCAKGAFAPCFKDCYARKLQSRRPTVLHAYADNMGKLEENLPACEAWLNWWFDSPNAPRLFRIHVSGDFYSVQYFHMWQRIAKRHPQTSFLAFTKQFDVVKNGVCFHCLPKNLILIASAWPGVDLPPWVKEELPIAYMQDGTETRIPESAHICTGNCAGECMGYCWNMRKGMAVVLPKH